MNNLLWRTGAGAVVICAVLSSGCATVTGSELQAVSVETYDERGDAVAGAECRLSNNNGAWSMKTPGTVDVRKSSEDLVVRCEMEDRPVGLTRAVSRVNGAMFGNIIFGGIVGAAIDHSKGTAYDYPTYVRVVFGANRSTSVDDVNNANPRLVSSPPPQTAPPSGKATLDDLDGLLKSK